MYCIQCGVELSPGQRACPLCGIRVYHPDLPTDKASPTYPQTAFTSEEFNRRGLLFVISMLCLLPLSLPLIFEFLWHGTITWSGYVAGAVIFCYICLILPCWFRRANPVVFLSFDVAAATLYLAYINFQNNGNWFLTFAMPTSLSFGIIIVSVVALLRYIHLGHLYIYGGGIIAIGLWTILLEFLVGLTFGITAPVTWSLFSCTTLFILGLLLILIEIIKPLKASLYRMFFIGSLH